MGTVPIIEGTVESGPIDPGQLSHDDILDLAKRYQDAVGVIDQQKRLMAEANRVIMKLQAALQELKGEINAQQETEPRLPAQRSDTPRT